MTRAAIDEGSSAQTDMDTLLGQIVNALTREQRAKLMTLLEEAGAPKARGKGSPNPEFVNTADMRLETGLSARYITEILIRRTDFPKPVMNLTQKTRLWERVEWENWKRRRAGIPKLA